MAKKNIEQVFALCVENKECGDLEKRKIYKFLPDNKAAKEGHIRIINKSEKNDLYSESYFILVESDLSYEIKMALEDEFCDHYVKRFEGYDTILDACSGFGFLSASLANKYKVIALEINPIQLDVAKKLAEMRGIKITFISGDILDEEVLKSIGKINAAFLDPDLKRGHSVEPSSFNFYKMEPPLVELLTKIQAKTGNIALRLPKETNFSEFDRLISVPYELEEGYLRGKLMFYTVYFGTLAKISGRTQFKT
jgi:hypothetical protein